MPAAPQFTTSLPAAPLKQLAADLCQDGACTQAIACCTFVVYVLNLMPNLSTHRHTGCCICTASSCLLSRHVVDHPHTIPTSGSACKCNTLSSLPPQAPPTPPKASEARVQRHSTLASCAHKQSKSMEGLASDYGWSVMHASLWSEAKPVRLS